MKITLKRLNDFRWELGLITVHKPTVYAEACISMLMHRAALPDHHQCIHQRILILHQHFHLTENIHYFPNIENLDLISSNPICIS